MPTLEDAIGALGGRSSVEVWTTAARRDVGRAPLIADYDDASRRLRDEADPRAVLVVFGTSWGLAPQVVDASDARLPPIEGVDDYNHLSVRAACAIVLDRLVSV